MILAVLLDIVTERRIQPAEPDPGRGRVKKEACQGGRNCAADNKRRRNYEGQGLFSRGDGFPRMRSSRQIMAEIECGAP